MNKSGLHLWPKLSIDPHSVHPPPLAPEAIRVSPPHQALQHRLPEVVRATEVLLTDARPLSSRPWREIRSISTANAIPNRSGRWLRRRPLLSAVPPISTSGSLSWTALRVMQRVSPLGRTEDRRQIGARFLLCDYFANSVASRLPGQRSIRTGSDVPTLQATARRTHRTNCAIRAASALPRNIAQPLHRSSITLPARLCICSRCCCWR